MLVKTKFKKNERLIFSPVSTPSHNGKANWINVLMWWVSKVWNDPICLLDIAHKCKTWHLCYYSWQSFANTYSQRTCACVLYRHFKSDAPHFVYARKTLVRNNTSGLCVISSVSNFISLEMALLSEHLQTDGFESFWYSNFVYLMIALYISWFHLV